MYGVDWDTLAKEIPTKEKTQIKNYYQNYKLRLELDQIELPQNAKHPKASRGRGQGGVDSSRASTPRPGQSLPTSVSSVCIHIHLLLWSWRESLSVHHSVWHLLTAKQILPALTKAMWLWLRS